MNGGTKQAHRCRDSYVDVFFFVFVISSSFEVSLHTQLPIAHTISDSVQLDPKITKIDGQNKIGAWRTCVARGPPLDIAHKFKQIL